MNNEEEYVARMSIIDDIKNLNRKKVTRLKTVVEKDIERGENLLKRLESLSIKNPEEGVTRDIMHKEHQRLLEYYEFKLDFLEGWLSSPSLK